MKVIVDIVEEFPTELVKLMTNRETVSAEDLESAREHHSRTLDRLSEPFGSLDLPLSAALPAVWQLPAAQSLRDQLRVQLHANPNLPSAISTVQPGGQSVHARLQDAAMISTEKHVSRFVSDLTTDKLYKPGGVMYKRAMFNYEKLSN